MRGELPPPAGRYLTDDEVKRCDLSLTDEFRSYWEYILRVFQFFGLVVIIRRDNGILEFKWTSPQCFYSLLLLSIRIYIVYAVTVERLHLMDRLTERSFDEDLFLNSLHVFNLYEVLPVAFILESPKIVNFLNSLAEFQARYYHMKGTPLVLKLRNYHKYIYPLVAFAFFAVLFLVNFMNVRSVYTHVDENVLQAFIDNVVSGGFVIMDIVTLHLLWVSILWFMQFVTISFTDAVTEAFRSGDEATMDGFENLWIDLTYAAKYLGNASTLSLGWHFILAILTATFELFLAIRQEHALLILYGSSLFLSLIVFLVLADEIMYRLSQVVKHRLMDVKKGAHPKRKRRINQFLKLMSGFDERISLGGFTTINNGLVSSVMNNVTTYIIILVQFKQDGQN